MKKFMFFIFALIVFVITVKNYGYLVRNHLSLFEADNLTYIAKVDDKDFYIYKYGSWHKEFIKGVNMGAAKPGYFPGEFGITKEDYLRWFRSIGEMNANSIRVYTILSPAFYEAFYEYNQTAVRPLYLFQGVWVNEEDIIALGDAQHPQIKNQLKEDIKTLVDIIHGNASISEKRGHASGLYTKNISPYVAGWILGIEWEPHFVIGTNEQNLHVSSFEGKYLYTKDSSPFEAFLCEIGDFTIDYETVNYAMQRPLSFTNWVTTDMLSHPNEPLEEEDMVSVNTEHIRKTEQFVPGLFASYHIYPYYPDFMNYQKNYTTFQDEDGQINTYRAYLRDLIKEHTVPVMVAEFGIPASRGKAHESIHMGFHQGNIDEKSQGEMIAFMLSNIYEEGYCGGLVFAWQDEWFKRTWNTMDLDIPDRRAYWSNPQTNEQQFGLLAFDPGEKESIVYVDGNPKEWKNDQPFIQNNHFKLYARSDEKYLYLYADIEAFDFNEDQFIIPIDVTPKSGNLFMRDMDLIFSQPIDFLVTINTKENSRITVDAYYDAFQYIYGSTLEMIDVQKVYETQNSGIFNPIYLALNRPLFLPEDKVMLPFLKYETGRLHFGNANPKSSHFDSLADFHVNNNHLEIRIPWQLLNIMDPSTKKVMDDFHEKTIVPTAIEGIYIGGTLIRSEASYTSDLEFYSWESWDLPTYHERLKPSYYTLQNAFKIIGGE